MISGIPLSKKDGFRAGVPKLVGVQAEQVQELAAKLRRLPTDFCNSDRNKPKGRGFFESEAFQGQTGLNSKLGVLVAPSLS